MSELKPCPNPECVSHKTGERPVCIGDELPDELFIVKCLACELSGPVATSAATAETRWNALPREERWVPVSEGLPEPDDRLWDVAICYQHPEGGPMRSVKAAARLRARETRDGTYTGFYAGGFIKHVTHYRPHTPPRGPEEA